MFSDLLFSLIVWNFMLHFGHKGTKNMFQMSANRSQKNNTLFAKHWFIRENRLTLPMQV